MSDANDKKIETEQDLLDLAVSYVEKGKEIGREEGRKEGIATGVRAVVINMIQEGYKDAQIMSLTGLSQGDLAKLKTTL